jgi:hypothetical protein
MAKVSRLVFARDAPEASVAEDGCGSGEGEASHPPGSRGPSGEEEALSLFGQAAANAPPASPALEERSRAALDEAPCSVSEGSSLMAPERRGRGRKAVRGRRFRLASLGGSPAPNPFSRSRQRSARPNNSRASLVHDGSPGQDGSPSRLWVRSRRRMKQADNGLLRSPESTMPAKTMATFPCDALESRGQGAMVQTISLMIRSCPQKTLPLRSLSMN